MTDKWPEEHPQYEPIRRRSSLGMTMLAVAAMFGAIEPFQRPSPPSARPLTDEEKARREKHAQERIAAAQTKRDRKAAKKVTQ